MNVIGNASQEADICIVAEGSYPYTAGGVAEWVHQLINEHKERTFHILTLLPANPDLTMRYKLPDNVISQTVYIVQNLPSGSHEFKTPKETWDILGTMLKGMIGSKDFDAYDSSLLFFRKYYKVLGRHILCESMEAWKFVLGLYEDVLPSGPFKAYFGTIYTLSRSIFSVMLPELPKARLFHSVCTGYAGFILYRAKKENNVPCIVTEHGIYSNERRIEIAMAQWITEMDSLNLDLENKNKTLKDFWLNAFLSLAHACYISCDEIISTYDGNQIIQVEGGADPEKVSTIVHGILPEKYSSIVRTKTPRHPTIAFIGRCVPIKDVKTFIRACYIIKQRLPKVHFYALGPTDEDPDYFDECQALVEKLDLVNDFKFFGRVNLMEYVCEIDLIVFTSISEAQPLVIIEMGAAGIPFVATNVGACDQLLNGAFNEAPNLGPGGLITPLVNPEATADAVLRLLNDRDFYERCSKAIAQRISTYYNFKHQHEEYRKIYNKYLSSPTPIIKGP